MRLTDADTLSTPPDKASNILFSVFEFSHIRNIDADYLL